MPISFIDVQGIPIAVSRLGQGHEPVLFIHGLGSNHRCWDQAARYFSRERYTLYFVDLPGFGQSAKPDEFSYSMQALADCLSSVIRHFQIERLHLIAHSMGGVLALLLASDAPLTILSLTLAEGNLVTADAFMSGKIAHRSEAQFVKSYALWVSVQPSFMTNETEQQRQAYSASLQQASAVAMYRAAKSCAEWSQAETLQGRFARLTCPRAYAVGEKTRLRRALPEAVLGADVTLFEVPGQGHFMMEDAEGFYIPLTRWMDSLERP